MTHRTESSPEMASFSTRPLQAGGAGWAYPHNFPLPHFSTEEDGVLTSSILAHKVHFLFRLEKKTTLASECTLFLQFLALNMTSYKRNLFYLPVQPPFSTGTASYLLPLEICSSPPRGVGSSGAGDYRFLTSNHKHDDVAQA